MEGYQQHPYHQSYGEQETAGDRFPQWSAGETKEFLAIRAELDRAFMETKRNKALWEVMAARLKEMGFARTAEQCKSKWKNLVTRYKGCETMEPEALRQQFPYYNELHAIFSARLHHMLWTEAEGSGAASTPTGPTTSTLSRKRKAVATTSTHMPSDDDDEYEVEERESIDDEENIKKPGPSKSSRGRKKRASKGDNQGELKEVLERFMKEEEEREARWIKRWEEREDERRKRDETWRQKMEALEAERRRIERSWMEREEMRRVREEARAIKRDALINQLLSRLS